MYLCQDIREKSQVCLVCMTRVAGELITGVACGHLFCKDCWQMYLQVQISSGLSTSTAKIVTICKDSLAKINTYSFIVVKMNYILY